MLTVLLMPIAPAPENLSPLRSLSEALGKALATNAETVMEVMTQAFAANPALAVNADVREGLRIGAAMARHSGVPPEAKKWLANLAASPTMPEALKKIREALGMSQRKLGQELGVTDAMVCEWEKGTRRMSERALCALIRLAKKKGVDVSNPQAPAPRPSGNALRNLRQSMGLSRAEMGGLLGLSETSVRLYEGRDKPPEAVLTRIADVIARPSLTSRVALKTGKADAA
jgi:transcriptional regulator with XRE-family HTH domain